MAESAPTYITSPDLQSGRRLGAEIRHPPSQLPVETAVGDRSGATAESVSVNITSPDLQSGRRIPIIKSQIAISMTDTEQFIYQFDGSPRDIMLFFDRLLTSDFGLRGKISYKIPFYYNKSWICYLNPLKDGMVELAFTRGNELSNVQGLLQNKGRKQVSGIDLQDLSAITIEPLKEIIHEAILLDESIPYTSKRQK